MQSMTLYWWDCFSKRYRSCIVDRGNQSKPSFNVVCSSRSDATLTHTVGQILACDELCLVKMPLSHNYKITNSWLMSNLIMRLCFWSSVCPFYKKASVLPKQEAATFTPPPTTNSWVEKQQSSFHHDLLTTFQGNVHSYFSFWTLL